MKALVTAKIGTFLVVSSVLAVWTFLGAQSVQAHTLTNPTCSGLPAADFFTSDEQIDLSLSGGSLTGADAKTPKPGTGESGEGSTRYRYVKITVPALTAGDLRVFDAAAINDATYSSEAILCGRQEGNVSSLPSYVSAHTSADSAANTANSAQTAAQNNNTASGESTARSALYTAARALATYNSNGDLTGGIAYALTRADAAQADINAATGAADASLRASGREDSDGTAGDDTDDNTNTEVTALRDAANALRTAAHALDPNMGFDINTLISSGDEEYVVVVSASESTTTTPSVDVEFRGVMSTDATASAGDSFTSNNQQHLHTLRATDPGLLTVETTGNSVDTKGTLTASDVEPAMDEGSGGNFEIVSPMDDDVDYTVQVEGQTRSERGDYGLKLAFRVAVNLGTNETYADTTLGEDADEMIELERGQADYYFFTADADLFLTVQTKKHEDVTTETNTIGALFSQDGLIITDTNSGTGNNFLFRVPIASGKDYIIEVEGSSSSTEGEYVLATTSVAAPTRGIAPDEIMVSATDTEITAAGEVDPHSITVTKAGTLQVKTTGNTDTVGILYGPDGRQIATDDNSGEGTNFLITEYVQAGQYIVTVEGQSRTTTMAGYILVVNFVEGADIDVGTGTGTGPGTGTGTETEEELREQIEELRDDLEACRMPVETDARGNLENPSDGSFRSGIGVISGWVCAAEEVEVQIRRAPGVLVETLTVAYGTSRPDVPENSRCTNENAGFGMTYNFNHLSEGEYTMTAFADEEPVGDPRTFEVVHLTTFAANDTNRFLTDLPAAECRVNDFPAAGEDTFLLWEQSTQNFVIEDAG